MYSDVDFQALMARIRARDEDAAVELVREYRPVIENAIRLPLMHARLYRVLDATDICQTVLANFFARVRAGQFQLEHPAQLIKLLVSMARNQVTDEVRHHHAGRRDRRRLESASPDELFQRLGDGRQTPSKVVAGHELVREMYRRLSAEERELAEQRVQGRDWIAIAAQHGSNPDALRKKLARAMDRVVRQLGLEALRAC